MLLLWSTCTGGYPTHVKLRFNIYENEAEANVGMAKLYSRPVTWVLVIYPSPIVSESVTDSHILEV